MLSDERGVERAEDFERQQTEARVAAIRAANQGYGTDVCIACGDEITEDRKRAVPNATRCADCQADAEFASRRDFGR